MPFASGTGRFGHQKKTDYSRLVIDRDAVLLRNVLLSYGAVGELSVTSGMLLYILFQEGCLFRIHQK